MPRDTSDYSCPSAQPDSEDARVFGVVVGDVAEPRIAYLAKDVVVSEEMIQTAGGVSPTRIFRFAGKCVNGACAQFKDGGCRLGGDVSKGIAPVSDRLPPCTIRRTCRWFAENGPDVCLRCARVVTTLMGEDTTLSPIAANVSG